MDDFNILKPASEASAAEKDQLWHLVNAFITKHEISCDSKIYQTDDVVEDSLEFVEGVCDIVGYFPYED